MTATRGVPPALCLLVLGAVGLCAAGDPRGAGDQRRVPPPFIPIGVAVPTSLEQNMSARILRLQRWLKASARHAPGTDDDALEEVAAWPNANLRELWIDANVLVQIVRHRAADRFTVRSEGQKTATPIRYTATHLRRLHVLACAAGGALTQPECLAVHAADQLDPELLKLSALAREAAGRGDDNYILRRGALLHTDVAVLAPLVMAEPIATPLPGGAQRLRMDISDGQQINLGQSSLHWEIARMLLDFVTPRGGDRAGPGGDDMVRRWYGATAAWMQLREDHDKLHLDRAREIFPADPDILFLSGCQREIYAGAAIQAAVRSAVLPTGVTLDAGSERGDLREAEAFFKRTLERRPDHAEARLRHGRVLGALGRHAEAAVELRRAVAELEDAQLLYYGALFLGAEEEALANRDAARASYERAATLAPYAQSPLLALSQLARRFGDRPAALNAMGRIFALPNADRGEHDDPWWWYYMAQAGNAQDLLDALRRPFLADRLQ